LHTKPARRLVHLRAQCIGNERLASRTRAPCGGTVTRVNCLRASGSSAPRDQVVSQLTGPQAMNGSLIRCDQLVPASLQFLRRRQEGPARLSRKARWGLAMAGPRRTAFFSGPEQSNWNFNGIMALRSLAPAGLVLRGAVSGR
jgi:hypothetical protein